jgi:hypothetical protein
MYGNGPERKSDTPLSYFGHFPQNYTIRQEVQQWSPVSLRTLSLEPENVKLPAIDWSDSTLITTPEGNIRLKATLLGSKPPVTLAGIFHNGVTQTLIGAVSHGFETSNQFFLSQEGQHLLFDRSFAVQQLYSYIPTASLDQSGLFRIVSQVAPQGAGSFEDLAFYDSTDPNQWALVIMITDGDEFHVFRKLYLVEQ